MTSEEIIERLIDEKKITVKDAMIILKDLARESVKRMFYPTISDNLYRDQFNYCDPTWNKITIDNNTKNLDDVSLTASSVYNNNEYK